MNANVQITMTVCNDTERFVVVKRGSENLYMAMGLCQFRDEMAYWGMPARGGRFQGQPGYLFPLDIPPEDIRREIERFLLHNHI